MHKISFAIGLIMFIIAIYLYNKDRKEKTSHPIRNFYILYYSISSMFMSIYYERIIEYLYNRINK